jgi:hypothetical protein
VQVVVDGPHHHLAGVEPHSEVHGQAVCVPHLVTVAAQRGLHPQGGIARPHGMIFMCDRRAEEGHNPIPHDLIHRALVAVHRHHHALQHRVEELARLLGVAVCQQLHRGLQVGEEHGHLLALALQGTAGRENLLG